jgi:hypothetical protein
MMPMQQHWNAQCAHCGTLGPEGENSLQAQAYAAEKGWRMGRKEQQGGKKLSDLCPDCLPLFSIRMCEEYGGKEGSKTLCLSQAMYRVSYKGKERFGCGKHAWVIIRDICRAEPDSDTEPTVKQIREAIGTPKK